ncbi:L,D-transpeptidase family protein [Sphingomonas sp. LY29]|uniref:L,D-transpeptidase family protein n=1 Tax=unclassified Sphingomonas TaxID=196159 RepID=UPI002ADEEDAB|nr:MULTISPECIES: L,D-transpeptidase family protein [unclassified Sphingomonas]MEA1072903.1 L,D-transpeptidase family protein [Sphingomonas sp. LY160]WRP26799.1 L,D-transpeptidase family protein [Sphingomonas sp. LY29]
MSLIAVALASSPAIAKKKPAPPPPPAAPIAYTPIDRFYAARQNAPLWGNNVEAQAALVQVLREAPLDGFTRGPALAAQIEAARANPATAKAADKMMSQALIDYVRSLYTPIPGMTYGDNWVKATPPSGESVLAAAARAPSLAAHVRTVMNLNPVYGQLRAAAVEEAKLPGGGQSSRLALNMTRVRFKPPSNRFVMVDVPSARLWMYENGVPVDSMKVVVGENKTSPDMRTPMIASVMYYTIYNPYWHMPDHLVPNMAKAALAIGGAKALAGNKYEVVDAWSANPTILDANKVDWKGVLAGTTTVKLRQKPTGANSMGKMKFPFENGLGIYLHDTPKKEYFKLDNRAKSNGCIRLERAQDFGTWMMRRPANPDATTAELTVPFPQGVPVYVTYLTALPEDGKIAYHKDIYGYDSAAMGAAATATAVVGQ